MLLVLRERSSLIKGYTQPPFGLRFPIVAWPFYRVSGVPIYGR